MKDDELGIIYNDKDIICKEGDSGDCMYIIQSGNVCISKKTDYGDIEIATLKSGEIFGDMALFDKRPRSATAIAVGEARLLCIDKEKLFSLINRDPTLVFKVLETMSRRIRVLDDEFTKFKKDKLDVLDISMDIDEICKITLEEARNSISADGGSVMLLDERDNVLSIKAAFGDESDEKLQLSDGKGIAGDVLTTGKAELVNNASRDPRYVYSRKDIHSLICVPLKGRNKKFGVINMSNSTNKMFGINDLKALDSLAVFASLAIENARLFHDLKHATNEVILSHATMLDVW